MEYSKNRNHIVDSIRGMAMLLVVLGHTISGCTSNYQGSFLYQIVWTLQMPLFVIISGYVTKYGRPISTMSGLLFFFKKRTLSYIFPWAVWTFFIRGLIFGQSLMLDFKYIIWHMDSGYWFLITIWTISMIFGISDYISNRIKCKGYYNILSRVTICMFGMGMLVLVGLKFGFSFCCIKLTVYYIPFYVLGFIYGQLQNDLSSQSLFRTVINCIICISLAIWLSLISRYDFFAIGDSGAQILARFVTSLLGCIAIIGLFTGICQKQDGGSKISDSGVVLQLIEWIGRASLSVYLIHYLILCVLKSEVAPSFPSVIGWVLVLSNFMITVLLSMVFIKIIESNSIMNKILFWK